MFLGHLYVQLDILQDDERQAGSYHIVTTSTHSTILQYLLWEHCVRRLAKCKSVRFAKEKYRSCPKVITYHWVGLKPFGYPAVEFFEFFDKRIGFC